MNILMPQLGETVAEGKIVKWFKRAGDAVKPGDNLFEIETDKTSMEVPATSAGTLSQILFQVGETAKVGAVVAVLADGDVSVARETPAPPPLMPAQAEIRNESSGPRPRGEERSSAPMASAKPILMDPFREVRTPERNFGPARLPGGATVTPLARRLAGENGIDLARVKGSGPHGRIVASDIAQTIAERRRTGSILGEQAAPQLTIAADIAVGALLDIRDEANAARPDSPVAIRDFVLKAWALSLQRVPVIRTGFAREENRPFDQSDIAVVMAGGATAWVRDAGTKTVGAIADELRDAGRPAAEARGASTAVICIDDPGIREISLAIRPPQTAVLAVGAVRRQPFEAPDNSLRFESVVTATLSCDARILDAASGAQLLSAFKGFIEKPVTMLV
ncbi:MAG: 2-oxo acid dehydrogenase subunit E2 [Pseudorhodoplanes sp.]|nr:2-oxo acid dehydrogenase subunit E2 [Pseudorhodoplanes sp.]